MEGGEGGDDLIENTEIFNIPWDSEFLENLPNDVTAIPQSQMLQDDDSLENVNLIQNPNSSLLNPNLNQNRNQGQQQALSPPSEDMHLNSNHNNSNEPPRPPRYQLNAERFISSNHVPRYQNQYMRRQPSQPSTNIASSSGGVTGISTSSRKRGDELQPIQSQPYGVTMNHPRSSGSGSSALGPMQHNMEDFVRNTRMRISPGQGRPSVVAESISAQHNMGSIRPSLNPGQFMANSAQSTNTLSNPLARPGNPIHPPSNTLSQARPNPKPGDPMASHAEYSYNHSIPLEALNLNYFSIPPERPNINPDHPMCNHALASNTRSISQARPNSNPGHPIANNALASNTLSIPQARPNLNPGHPMDNPALASNTRTFPLAGGRFVPRVNSYMSPMQIPVTPTARSSVPVAGVTSQSHLVNQAIPAALSSSHHQSSHTQAASRGHCGCPECTRAITSLGASHIRSQGVSVHQAVPATPSVPASSDSQAAYLIIPGHAASQINSQGVSVHPVVPATPNFRATTASASQIRNSRALVVPVGPRYMLTRGNPRQVWLPVQVSNLSRHAQERALLRALYPEADERQLDILVEGAREMMIEWRQVDRHVGLRLDTDHMSHEELMALQEMIGDVNTGVSEEIVIERMIQRTFSASSAKGSETCCICLEEFAEGDQVGTLDCGHSFHSECIKKWLAQKNTCPICKMPGIGPKKNNG